MNMEILITKEQLKVINEQALKKINLCSKFGSNTSFCNKIESAVKDFKTGGKDNIYNKSANFFNKVVSNNQYFDTVVLSPGGQDYEERVAELVKFKKILEDHNSCPNMVEEVTKDLENLKTKGLVMVVDDEQKYSLLNRLDTHYSAKGYLLTHLILSELSDFWEETNGKTTNLNEIPDTKIRELLNFVMTDEHVDSVSEYLSDLLKNNEEFRKDFIGSIEYSRETGNKVENEVFDALRQKYGEENVVVFSGDYGFVDYFGVDGVVVINDVAHPIQISSTAKSNPKIFRYASEYCKPLGYSNERGKIFRYEPVK
jgi:chemotaxis methyl-accepting protein methylase